MGKQGGDKAGPTTGVKPLQGPQGPQSSAGAGSALMGHSSGVCTQGTDCSEDEHAGIWPMGLLSLEEWSAVRASSGLIRSLLRRGPAGLERELNWK